MAKAHALKSAVEKITAASKTARLRDVLPEVEQRLRAGARIADVVKTLNENGLPISIATLKSYLYRFRKAARESGNNGVAPSPDPQSMNAGHRHLVTPERYQTTTDATVDTATTTPMLLRHINTARCLRLLRRGATYSRADLARELGLTRATIGHAVRELIDSGLVIETIERLEGGRPGRPGSGVCLNPQGAYAIGIDISSITLTAVLVDLGMRVVHRLSQPVEPHHDNVNEVVEQISRLASRLIAAASIDSKRVHGIGVSVPGLVDRSGRVVIAPFLRWNDVPLRQILSERRDLPWPITVCNDAVAFATAEQAVSNDRDAQNMLLILLTEGLGGAIVQRGQILEGARGYAGELGHMVMGAKPGAISTQTFEVLAGYERFRPFLPKDRSFEDGLKWLAAAGENTNTPALEKAFAEWADVLTTGLLNLVYLLDPEKIVLGGPLSALFPRVEPRVRQALAAHLMHGFAAPPIFITRFGTDGAAIGAASVIREQIFSLPNFGRG